MLATDLLSVRGVSVATARNKGLRIARSCGWNHVMFMDDDILVHSTKIMDAARLLPDTQIVAFTPVDFPDNSVVRHAQRTTGAEVPVYPSGAAMLVNMKALPKGRKFPEIYNEDWLFMHGLEVIPAGNVTQRSYNPFVPGRALREEFGDLIAEAIRDRDVTDDRDFWEGKIAERRSFLDSLDVTGAAKLSVDEAKEALGWTKAEHITDFIRAWQNGSRRA